ncbi:ferrochelatase (plasmid) [Pseudoalteromonas espejiana]
MLQEQGYINTEAVMAMRYGNPSIEAGAASEELRDEGLTRIIVLPLYPQYSSPTTGSTRSMRFQMYYVNGAGCLSCTL